jgi:hypothetical protein
MDHSGKATEGIELAIDRLDGEVVERLRQVRKRAPTIRRWIIFVEPRYRFALVAAAGRIELCRRSRRRQPHW